VGQAGGPRPFFSRKSPVAKSGGWKGCRSKKRTHHNGKPFGPQDGANFGIGEKRGHSNWKNPGVTSPTNTQTESEKVSFFVRTVGGTLTPKRKE